jgi:hypothetical protein
MAVIAAVWCGAAVSASAQQGSFRLPFEAKWEGVVCPPGEYRVSLPERYLGRTTFLIRGPAGASFIVPMTVDTYRGDAESPMGAYLQLVRLDDGWFVKKYEVGSGNLTYYFKTPKASHRVQIASQEVATIPISGN